MNEKQAMMNDMVRDLTALLIEDMGLPLEEALDAGFNSETYTRIMDEKTKFYIQSSRYVYAFLKIELTTGKLS